MKKLLIAYSIFLIICGIVFASMLFINLINAFNVRYVIGIICSLMLSVYGVKWLLDTIKRRMI